MSCVVLILSYFYLQNKRSSSLFQLTKFSVAIRQFGHVCTRHVSARLMSAHLSGRWRNNWKCRHVRETQTDGIPNTRSITISPFILRPWPLAFSLQKYKGYWYGRGQALRQVWRQWLEWLLSYDTDKPVTENNVNGYTDTEIRDGKEAEPSKNEPNQNPRTEANPNPKVKMCKNSNWTEPYSVKSRTDSKPTQMSWF